MSPELRTIIQRYNVLPEPIQQDIFYGGVKSVAELLAQNYGFDSETQVALENEFTLVLLGFTRFEDLEEYLKVNFGFEAELAKAIAIDFDALIIEPLIERLVALNLAIINDDDDDLNSEPDSSKITDLESLPNSNDTLHYEPVHTSIGQDSLRRPLSETPSYNQPPENRTASNHRPDLEPPMRWGQ